MSQAVDLLEYVSVSPGKVDREAGVIHDVKVLGQRSANGRRYLPEAIENAVKLYEGREVNCNHPIKPGEQRSVYDRFGWLEGLHIKDGELYAKRLHYLKSHSMAGPLTEAGERRPQLFGLSHNARGSERKVGKEAVIESIESVISVDLVADPATVKGLHESRGNAVATTLKDILEALKSKPHAIALKEMMDAAGMSPESPMDAPPEKPDDAIKAGFKAAIHAVVDDDSMDMQAKLSKIKEILKAQEKLMGGGKKPDEGSDGKKPPTEKPAEESRATPAPTAGETVLREELDRLKRKDRARELCEEASVKPSPALLKALVALPEEADVKALIEEHKPPVAPSPAPRTTGKPKSGERPPAGGVKPITESAADKAPTETKALGRWLKE